MIQPTIMTFSYQTGDRQAKSTTLAYSTDLLLVRTRKDAAGLRRDVVLPKEMDAITQRRMDVYSKGVAMFEVTTASAEADRASIKATLQKMPEFAFAGRVLQHDLAKEPAIYTENLFIRFKSRVRQADRIALLKQYGIGEARPLPWAAGAYQINALAGIGTDVFALAERLLESDLVRLCHPEVLWMVAPKSMHPNQWHMGTELAAGKPIGAHAHVHEAHALSRGAGVCIAVIDNGVEVTHPEFAAAGKCVHPYDFHTRTADGSPKHASHNHGTNCAGVACASGVVAPGVAPDATLMPLIMPDMIGSFAEAEAICWAADHGADVISCSWGPKDGSYLRKDDPLHQVSHLVPDHTRLAIEYATQKGRKGKGCVITWAAGNGNESVDLDGYAAHPAVMAIGACNERGARSIFSDYGTSLACCFPSGDYHQAGKPALLTKGLYVADRVGMKGISGLDYTDAFTGTSAATPGVAGVAALVLSIAPHLTNEQVKAILLSTCDQIDAENVQYDQGTKHSLQHGYGRVHALRAVQTAKQGLIPVVIPPKQQIHATPNTQLLISAIRVSPPKGELQAIKILNKSATTFIGSVKIVCGKKSSAFTCAIQTNQTIDLQFSKTILPSTKGMVELHNSQDGTFTTAKWQKKELNAQGWKSFN
jgi:subtilisin family serine protease